MKGRLARLAALLLVGAGCRTVGPAAAPGGAGPVPAQARPWAGEILYFALVDRFADGDPSGDAGADPAAPGGFHGGDLRGLREQLDEIASLGVTALWVNPLVKNIDGPVFGAGFADWGYHGYWADDLGRLDPRFGSEEELRRLVEACHARGIRVLLDVVYNHAGYGTRYLSDSRTRGWLRSAEHGGCGEDELTSCLAGLPTDFPWGRGLVNYRPEEEGRALETYATWARLFELLPYYSWLVDRFHLSTRAFQIQAGQGDPDLRWLEERLRPLGFRHVLCWRRPETFEAARAERLRVSGNPSQYDDLGPFIREQELFRRLVRGSSLPFLELDVSDGDVAGAAERVADWLEATGGLHAPWQPPGGAG